MALSRINEFKSPIRIKPDLSPEERDQESVLKERWSLIQKGAERKRIKLRNKALFVDNQLYGSFKGSEFARTNYNPPLQANSSDAQN